jgi:hypothetical protein
LILLIVSISRTKESAEGFRRKFEWSFKFTCEKIFHLPLSRVRVSISSLSLVNGAGKRVKSASRDEYFALDESTSVLKLIFIFLRAILYSTMKEIRRRRKCANWICVNFLLDAEGGTYASIPSSFHIQHYWNRYLHASEYTQCIDRNITWDFSIFKNFHDFYLIFHFITQKHLENLGHENIFSIHEKWFYTCFIILGY